MLDRNKVKLGIAPIAWTNDDLPQLGAQNTFEQCISEMALAGFNGSEIGNKYPKDPKALKKALDMRGMTICNSWFSTYFVEGKREETIEAFKRQIAFLKEVGAKVIGCSEQSGSIQGKDVPIFGSDKPVYTEDEWKRLTEGMNELGKIAKDNGMRCSYHHHMGTGVQTPAEIDRFMESTTEDVYLLFDSGHIYFSEGTQKSVDDLIDKYIKRIAHVHLKDVRNKKRDQVVKEHLSFLEAVKLGTFTVPGDGDISYDHIFEVLEKNDYVGYILVEAEQDPGVANPLEYAIKARSYINLKTGL